LSWRIIKAWFFTSGCSWNATLKKYDEGVLHEHEGNVFFVNESNWLIARLVNNMTGEIVQDDIILDSGSITDVLNSRDAFFDYIFGTENH